ncbi:MAG: hypothetical protein QXW10_04365 [Candidatus Micrarchaeaceae archaeon]
MKRQKGRNPSPKPKLNAKKSAKKGAGQQKRRHANRRFGMQPQLWKSAALQQQETRHALSYTDIMLRNIMEKNDSRAGISSSLLLHGLASMTGSMRTISYREGFSIGKSLYRMLNEKKNYSMFEESIPDLVSFFESAGLGPITYTAFSDRLTLSTYTGKQQYLGANMHGFEAGIMSGFVSAVRHEYSNVYEKECANNNSDRCTFIFSSSERQRGAPAHIAEGEELIGKIAEGITSAGSSKEGVSSSYLALLSNIVTKPEYIDEMKGIMAYIGGEIGGRLGSSSKRKLIGAVNILKNAYGIVPEIASFKPVSITINYDGTKWRKEDIDLSLAFLSGLLPQTQNSNPVKAIEINRYDIHKIRIAEEK